MSDKIYKEVDPYSGNTIDEDAPTNAVAHGKVAMPPDAMMNKKKKKLLDARTKEYRQHRERLEKLRQKRTEQRKKMHKEGAFQQDVLKSIAQFNIESLLAEDNLAIMRSIVKSKSNKPLKFSDGTMKCDLMTASAITQVYDKVNPANKKKLEKMMNGTKRDFLKLQSAAFKVMK
tara:strand:+ start:543 stop:1064 length:522 start_codon:yes stop_codon:yes gene_type:complete